MCIHMIYYSVWDPMSPHGTETLTVLGSWFFFPLWGHFFDTGVLLAPEVKVIFSCNAGNPIDGHTSEIKVLWSCDISVCKIIVQNVSGVCGVAGHV